MPGYPNIAASSTLSDMQEINGGGGGARLVYMEGNIRRILQMWNKLLFLLYSFTIDLTLTTYLWVFWQYYDFSATCRLVSVNTYYCEPSFPSLLLWWPISRPFDAIMVSVPFVVWYLVVCLWGGNDPGIFLLWLSLSSTHPLKNPGVRDLVTIIVDSF